MKLKVKKNPLQCVKTRHEILFYWVLRIWSTSIRRKLILITIKGIIGERNLGREEFSSSFANKSFLRRKITNLIKNSLIREKWDPFLSNPPDLPTNACPTTAMRTFGTLEFFSSLFMIIVCACKERIKKYLINFKAFKQFDNFWYFHFNPHQKSTPKNCKNFIMWSVWLTCVCLLSCRAMISN